MSRTPDLDDLDREIRDHIEEETLDNLAKGMTEEDARAAAIRKFGNVTRVKEDVRGVWIPLWVDQLRQDARDAWRSVRRRPAFSLAIVITLAMGIGLTTAIYSVVNAVLLRPLAYAHPERVVWLTTHGKNGRDVMTSIDFAAWQSQATSLDRVVAYEYSDSTVVLGGEATRLRILSASDGFWDITGAQPLLGELPTGPEPPALALSHRVFREQFNGDPGIIGHSVTVDGRPATIAAVMADSYQPQVVDLPFQAAFDHVDVGAYRVMRLTPPPQTIGPTTGVRLYQSIGQLKPGVSIEQARAEIETIHARQQREHPTPFGASAAVVMPLQEKIVGSSRMALGILLAAATIVLLIACANVANLLLSRSAERRKEIALRMSVGSGPARIVRQLLAESVAYAILGGASGVLFAWWLIAAVVSMMGSAVPRLSETTLDVGVLAVAAGISILTAILFGAGPAISLLFTNVQEVLKEGGRSVSSSRRVLVAGRLMAAAQVALTIVLLAGAGLMFKSVWKMTRYPDGFTPDRILTMRMDFRGQVYRDAQAKRALSAALLAKAQAAPGVREAAITTARESTILVIKEGEPVPPPPEMRVGREAAVSSVSAGFASMVGMSLAKGRWLNDVEPSSAVVINETLARRDFADSDPIGARIRDPYAGADAYATIVGVAHDLKYADIDRDPSPELFFHHQDTNLFSIVLMMRTDGDPLQAAANIRGALSTVDPTQSFYDVRTLEQALDDSIAPRRFNLWLLGTFALVALLLAVIGVYGVVAYAVAERTHEIGVRLALGAERAGVVRMMVMQGMTGVVAGVVIGLAAAWAATRLMTSLLYGVQPHDAATFAVTTLLLAVVAFLACAMPALKAAFVNPVIALRAE